VIGGAGFIGSHVVDELLRHRYEVTVADALHLPEYEGDWPTYLSENCERILVDIANPSRHLKGTNQLDSAISKADYVIHLAAGLGVSYSMDEPELFVHNNSVGTAALFHRESRWSNVKKVVVASSASIYGEGAYSVKGRLYFPEKPRSEADMAAGVWDYPGLLPVPIPESAPVNCRSVYGLTKYDQEILTLLLAEKNGVKAQALRLANVYGPRQSLHNVYTGVLSIFSQALSQNESPTIYEDGNQTRDFVYVKDVARAFRLAMESDSTVPALNIGSGEFASVMEVAKTLRSKLGKENVELKASGKYRIGDVRHFCLSIEKAKSVLGYTPEYSLEQGMSELLEWVKSPKT